MNINVFLMLLMVSASGIYGFVMMYQADQAKDISQVVKIFIITVIGCFLEVIFCLNILPHTQVMNILNNLI